MEIRINDRGHTMAVLRVSSESTKIDVTDFPETESNVHAFTVVTLSGIDTSTGKRFSVNVSLPLHGEIETSHNVYRSEIGHTSPDKNIFAAE